MKKTKEISAIFNDNVVHPMDEAMLRIEHVCKLKGAKHLNSHARSTSWFSYLLLDVIIFNVMGVLSVFYAICYLIKKSFARKSNQMTQSKKRKWVFLMYQNLQTWNYYNIWMWWKVYSIFLWNVIRFRLILYIINNQIYLNCHSIT